jgi:hypothetical protein
MLPVDKERSKLLNGMAKPLQEIAVKFDERWRRAHTGNVLLCYDIGKDIIKIAEDEGLYGQDALPRLAEFWGPNLYVDIDASVASYIEELRRRGSVFLMKMRDFATAFPNRQEVATLSGKSLPGGRSITMEHWNFLSRIEDESERKQMLNTVISQGLTSNQLEGHLKGGGTGLKRKGGIGVGRKPGIPISAVHGLQGLYSLCFKYTRYSTLLEKHVFDPLGAMGAAEVSDKLVEKARVTLSTMEEASEAMKQAHDDLKKTLKHLEESLKEKGEHDGTGDAEAAAPAAPRKAKNKKGKKKIGGGKATASASQNGKAKKGRRPQAATV